MPCFRLVTVLAPGLVPVPVSRVWALRRSGEQQQPEQSISDLILPQTLHIQSSSIWSSTTMCLGHHCS